MITPEKRKNLVLFLIDQGGKDECEYTWSEILEILDIPRNNKTLKQASDYWRYYQKTGKITPEDSDNNEEDTSFQEYEENKPPVDGLKIKSVWQNANGKWLFSYTKESSDEAVAQTCKKILDYINTTVKPFRWAVETTPNAGATSDHQSIVLSDLHIGALVKQLSITPDFNLGILDTYLEEIVSIVNSKKGKNNHIFILGDLIESFNGLNHKNSWKGLVEDAYGADIIITTYEILSRFINRLHSVRSITIVGGNHDRIHEHKEVSEKGDVAKIISYFLEKKFPSLDIIYDDIITSKEVDGINFVLTHGHYGLLNKNTLGELLFSYGKQNMFNLLLSGHIHSRKSTYPDRMGIMKDFAQYRHIVAPSIFTGNFFSESSGWTSSGGFLIITNKDGLPLIEDIPLKQQLKWR
jgi:predicted phosphodiesterase